MIDKEKHSGGTIGGGRGPPEAERRRLTAVVITGVHAIIFTNDPAQVRAFLRDVLGFPSVDAGRGWLIFALPPAELAAHPADDRAHHELYLMSDDIRATVAEPEAKAPSARSRETSLPPSSPPTR